MNLSLPLVLSILISSVSVAQDLTGPELLDKAIAYHDPNGQWATFNESFTVIMTRPNESPRESQINISLPEEYFSLEIQKDAISTRYVIDKEECQMFYQGEPIGRDNAQSVNMSCERGNTYLYGLPMKLKDPGTHISSTVEKKAFQGKPYLTLKATYDAEVGSDVWYFYFNPETYAMEVYQFFKTDEHGEVMNDSGEYILLSEEESVGGINMPKVRAWYYNKDDQYLATDTLAEK